MIAQLSLRLCSAATLRIPTGSDPSCALSQLTDLQDGYAFNTELTTAGVPQSVTTRGSGGGATFVGKQSTATVEGTSARACQVLCCPHGCSSFHLRCGKSSFRERMPTCSSDQSWHHPHLDKEKPSPRKTNNSNANFRTLKYVIKDFLAQ